MVLLIVEILYFNLFFNVWLMFVFKVFVNMVLYLVIESFVWLFSSVKWVFFCKWFW